jgi:hypothetical protein
VLRVHATYLNTEKYLNGKKLYLAYLQAKSDTRAVQYSKFIDDFDSQNYVNKMLKISALKYYRDIRNVLLGEGGASGVQEPLPFPVIDLGDVITALSAHLGTDGTFERKASSSMSQQKVSTKEES